jgi:hypothetical protein
LSAAIRHSSGGWNPGGEPNNLDTGLRRYDVKLFLEIEPLILGLLKRHLPYDESDHIFNITYNTISGGTCLEDIDLRRNDEAYLDALGAKIIPDPTTAGDFLRRFKEDDVIGLMDIKNSIRRDVWL